MQFHGNKFVMVFHRDQSLVRLFSISFSKLFFKWSDFKCIEINSAKSHILFSENDNVSANIDSRAI